MSRRVQLAASGKALPGLQTFATSLLAKATGSAVSFASGAAEAGTVGVAIGSEAPAATHTVVTQLDDRAGAAPYKDVKTAFVRSVLPSYQDEPLALRDALDILPGNGIKCDGHVAAAKASITKSVQIAIDLAKGKGSQKVHVLVKNVTKYSALNALFAEVVAETTQGTGISAEFVNSAALSNTLIVFPETVSVVVAADTPTAENVEAAFAGLLGGVERIYYTEAGAKVAGGNSVSSVANAVAAALRAQGLTAEAKKITDAAQKSAADANALVAAL